MSYVMSQGRSVVDVAVHYPAVSVLSEMERSKEFNYNRYMNLSRLIYDRGIDNDIIDDQSILNARIENGRLKINGNEYRAIVFEAEQTIRLSVLEKVLELIESGGVVLFNGKLPTASAENGRNDDEVNKILKRILSTSSLDPDSNGLIERKLENGGYAAFNAGPPSQIPLKISQHIDRDFIGGEEGDIYLSHRKIGELDVYLLQNTQDTTVHLDARFRADGVPELWNAFTGAVEEVNSFERKDGYTHVQVTMEGNVAQLLVIKPGDQNAGESNKKTIIWKEQELTEDWEFSVQATRNNLWGDFNWPPSNEKIGPEVRQFKYREETGKPGVELGWHESAFDDAGWEDVLFSTGPHWLALQEIPAKSDIVSPLLARQKDIKAGELLNVGGTAIPWEKISFSKTIGLAKPSPWGGHSGYPDGHFDKNFIQLKEGRKLLFTRIYSPDQQRLGLNVQLRNSAMQLWVNGTMQPFLGSIGNLPLNKGYNYVLLDLPDGSGGQLYVQKDPPAIMDNTVGNTDPTRPDLSEASWIWIGDTEGAYFRKSFRIQKLPESANVLVTGVSGFRLFINGQKVEEDIGPWATWDYPKSVNIKPYLQEGENVIAAWGQFFKGIHVSYSREYQGFIFALKAINSDGSVIELTTDRSWKGQLKEVKNWETTAFDDSDWEFVRVKGDADDEPWGAAYLQNLGGSSTPFRPLSVNLSTPYLEVFEEMPDIVYDIKGESDKRIGWYRFDAPPGVKEISIGRDDATVWVNGLEVSVSNGVAKVEFPPADVSKIVIRLVMEKGKYSGAAFDQPIGLTLEGGKIQLGLWQDFALPTYSGIGIYRQSFQLSEESSQHQVEIDLGEVFVSAEVLVNGQSAGVKVSAPYRFDLSQLVQAGQNQIEIRVANTLAPHYTIPRKTRDLGPTESGLVGPVKLKIGDS